MATTTTNYSFSLPLVGGDADVWGGLLNDNWSDLDSRLGGTFDNPGSGHLGTIKNTRLPTNIGGDKTAQSNGAPQFAVINGTTGAASIKGETSDGSRYFGIRSNTFIVGTHESLNSGTLLMEISSSVARFNGVLTGDGSGLTDVEIDAANIKSGTIPNARLSGNYNGFGNLVGSGTLKFAKLSTEQGPDVNVYGDGDADTGVRFPASNPNTFFLTANGVDQIRIDTTGITAINNKKFSGDGSGLTALDATALTGTLSISRFPTGSGANSWVGERYAGLGGNSVGAVRLLLGPSNGHSVNDTASGSTLRTPQFNVDTDDSDLHVSFTSGPSGTWKALGSSNASSNQRGLDSWVRIS